MNFNCHDSNRHYYTIIYSLFLWNAARSDFDSLADVSPQYTVKVFTNFGWFVLKDRLHAEKVAPLLIKTVTLGEEGAPYHSNLICDMDYQIESLQAIEEMDDLYLS